jgi:carboxypeptidase C (cathepsin A)
MTRFLLTLALASAVASGQGRRGGTEQQAEPLQARRGAPLEEKQAVTHHTARIGGQPMAYTATAANYIVKADDGVPKASFFFVAYTKENVPDISKRPIAFVYNGGPGSASFFTHMGLGPRRIVLTDDGHGMPAPYSIVENNDSFLNATDMVFVDAVSTGYSRPAPGEAPQQFYGTVQDAAWFSDFIYQWLTRNERWASPKFLIGESYGTTRSAQLAGSLMQRHKIYLNGIVLVSSVAFSNWGADDRFKFFLPTFITSAWYHKLLPPELQKENVESVAQAARQFAHGEYAAALEKGDELSRADREKVVKNLARLTGLSTKYIEQANLRISPQRWFKELLRDKRLTVGRLDSRFTGMDADAAGESYEYDSSQQSYLGAYTAMFQDYVRRDLKWTSDLYYTVSANVRPWDQGPQTGVAEVLRSSMTQESDLKVLVVCGYYDLATPFNGIEQTVSHMYLEPPFRKNISFTYYESGHMMYIDKRSREKLHKDVTGFIEAAYPH